MGLKGGVFSEECSSSLITDASDYGPSYLLAHFASFQNAIKINYFAPSSSPLPILERTFFLQRSADMLPAIHLHQ
jgi:hypothetical protein